MIDGYADARAALAEACKLLWLCSSEMGRTLYPDTHSLEDRKRLIAREDEFAECADALQGVRDYLRRLEDAEPDRD